MKKNQAPVYARAWDAVKAEEDPTFFNTAPNHQQELQARAADVIATGVTQNAFEAKVKELHESDKTDASDAPLAVTNAPGEAPPEAEKKVDTEAPAKTETAKSDKK
jgi:hypothetical protein